MTRRKFVGTAITVGGIVVSDGLPKLMAAVEQANTNMKAEAFLLGGDLRVNRLGFGAMRITGEGIWGWPVDRDNAKKVLRRAVELGVNLIDTADAYGPETSELLIAEALHPYPKNLVIATKGGLTRPSRGQWVPNGRPEHLSQAVDKSLARLKLERIDLYQLHAVDRKVSLEESVGALKKAQDAGKIRHVGLSNVTTQEIERARKILPIVSVQNEYNIADRKSEKVLLFCEKENLGFIPWFPLGGNGSSLLRRGSPLEAEGKRHNATVAQLALGWLLQKSPVMLPIPGTASLPHLEENMGTAKLQLTADDWKRIEDLARNA
jgi:pyridoxine 4-dehydrogenase